VQALVDMYRLRLERGRQDCSSARGSRCQLPRN
jgi:hypothetical protein